MTNDAPKRIGLIQDGIGNFALATVDEADVAIHYIHVDHAQAEKEAAVAAEREACADHWKYLSSTMTGRDDRDFLSELAEQIRARGDTDALAARDARVKVEALREAAAIGVAWTDNYFSIEDADAYRHIADPILALIPDEHKVDG